MLILRWAGRIWTGVLLLCVLTALVLCVLRLVLPWFAPQPTLLATTPATGAESIATRIRTTFHFSTPMNRRAVERALRVEPAVSFAATWNDTWTVLTISPTIALRPDTNYTISVGTAATSRLFHPLAGAQLAFHTLPAPAVLAVLPANDARNVPIDSALSIHFSRAIVPTTTLGLSSALPQLRFDPPVPGTLTWLDPATALLQPATPLRAATRYRAMLDTSLTDLNGEPLVQPFVWEFSTPAPTVLATTPTDGAQGVSQRAPLSLRVAPALQPGALAASLVITPSITGVVSATVLPNATQIITFTPAAGWQPATTYTAELRAGTPTLSGSLPLSQTVRWNFQTAPPPQLVGRLPGEDQTLAPDQPISLIFTTPVDPDALRAALRFTPPVSATQITASDTEAHISGALRAATTYTITLAPTLTDRNGVSTGQAYQIRFVTAPAVPTLLLPDAQAHVLHLVPPTSAVAIQRTNLSQLALSLYQLDEATIVRTSAFGESDWASFDPARYNLHLLRDWTQPLSATLNVAANTQIALGNGNQPLAPGAYYLRIRTPEGPRADVLVLSSRTQLVFQRGGTGGLLWATDVISGTPLDNVPLALYRDGSLIQRGTTDANGVWSIAGLDARAQPAYTALAGGGGPSVVNSTQAPMLTSDVPRVRALIFAEQAGYQPGERVVLGGFVRSAGPPLPSTGMLSLRPTNAPIQTAEQTLLLTSTGALSTSFLLPKDAIPGEYVATLTVGSEQTSTRFAVQPSAAPFNVAIETPPQNIIAQATFITMTTTLSTGLPLAGIGVTWTVSVEPLPPPVLADYQVGDETPPPVFVSRTGTGLTNSDGQLAVVITDTAQLATMPLRYRLAVRASEPGGTLVEATSSFAVQPVGVVVGARLADKIVQAGAPQTLDLLTATFADQPVPHTEVRVILFRRVALRTTVGDQRIFERTLTTDARGRALMPFSVPTGGEYRFQISASDLAGRTTSTSLPLWVTANGFADWITTAPDRAALITNQDRYRPGDTVTLLPASPFAEASALVVLQQGDTLTGTVQILRAGTLLTTTLRTDTPSARAAVWLVEQQSGPRRAGTRLAATTLPLQTAAAITTTLASDRASYAPGDTATLTVTTNVPAAVVLGANGLHAFTSPPTSVLTFAMQLPRESAVLPVQAWAADSAGHFGQAQVTLIVTRPLTLDIKMPPAVRPGDAPEIGLDIRNTSVTTQNAQVALTLAGARATVPLTRAISLLSGATERIVWPIVVSSTDVLSLSVQVQPDSGTPISATAQQRIISTTEAQIERGALVTERFSDTLTLPGATGRMLLQIAPSEQALRRQAARTLAAQLDRSVLDDASLLRISAPLTDTRPFARVALERLVATQRLDGGWGWWDGGPRDPFVTLAVLDALATTQGTELDLPLSVVERGLRALDASAFDASPALRAYRGYMRARYGETDDAALVQLAADPQKLGVETLAYLLLARPISATQSTLLDQLDAQALRGSSGTHWAATDSTLYPDDISATALAALALRQASPDSPLLPDALRWLAAQRGVEGWPSAYAGAFALDVLHSQAVPVTGERIVAKLNGASIFDSGTTPLTATREITISSLLRHENDFVLTTGGASVFISYRVDATQQSTFDHQRFSTAEGVGMVRDYLDPQTGVLLDPTTLRAGQLVQVRLTLVTHRALRFLGIDEPLLPGALLVAFRNGSFDHAAQHDDALMFARADLPAGVYQYRYMLRLVTAGMYHVPGARVRMPNAVIATGRTDTATIQR